MSKGNFRKYFSYLRYWLESNICRFC